MSVAMHDKNQLDPTTFIGNWMQRDAFAWSIRHRDSGLIEQSNAAATALIAPIKD